MPENKDILSAKRTIDREIEALKVMEAQLDENFVKALDLMQNTKGKIIVTGMGKSGHVGKKIAATLASTGTPSFFVHPGEASHGDLGMLDNKDVVLAISNGGESKELSDILMYCKRYGIPLIAVTKAPDSSLGKAGDVVLRLPNNGEACPLGLAPTSSTTATIVLGDILAIALLERKGFSKLDYNQRHPGGKLGAILQKVSDLMHKGNEMPITDEDTNIQDALMVMTSKMLGCVGIVNKKGDLTGIITDGDLRRFLSPDMFNKKVTDVMTRNPKVIAPDALAAEAVALMNGKKITQLFAVKDEKPLGIIHLHDCLRAGIA
ncbi:MAG: KpsF/GutQ family sugar-phosphate isomerase [Lactobacillaceae bacterium]|jgi:arabinose-5-phosphate isomerase|nr:KpsF/GutQ family sugar-phosphate isomerase [Lactobacillaceae bacterium]